MANFLDYVRWRGDLSFRQDPFNEVDAVVFSALSYIEYGGRVLSAPQEPISLKEAAVDFLAEGDVEHRVRVKSDLELLRLAVASYRFGQSQITQYRSIYEPEAQTQFAAMTFLLDDGTAFLAFRGTDGTLIGWKEDFNMTFQQTIPAQLLAQQYVREIALERSEPLRLGGHSKGGNLAVFAAARSSPMIQERILEVYNNDGPGFTNYLMGDPGYLAIVGRVRTFIPQSSVIGMLLEHEEPYTVVHSKSVGVLQHDLYSWDLMGNRLITMDNTTGDSVFLDATIKNWFASMNSQQRNALVDAMYGLLSSGGAENVGDILQPKNLKVFIKTLSADENLRKLLSTEFSKLIESARRAYAQLDQRREEEKLLEDAKGREGLTIHRIEEKT